MSSKFPKLFERGKIGCLELKNRIVKAPTYGCLSTPDGSVTDRMITRYEEFAHGGTGLVIVEAAYIDNKASKLAPGQIGVADVEHIPGLAALARGIQDNGAKAALQICHAGRDKFLPYPPAKSASNISPAGPDSAGRSNARGEQGAEELSLEEIQEIIAAYGDAAKRVQTAGFDMVEVHGSHGVLVTNFLSPATNRRTDSYGGSLQNRMRFLIEVIRDVRKKVGANFPLGVRLSGSDYEPGGVRIEETLEVARVLEGLGVDVIHVSGGSHVQGVHLGSPMSMPLAHHIREAEAIKKRVNIPVIASGSITTPELAEEILESGKADFISLGRPLFADTHWAQKAQEGRPEDITPCIRCNDGCCVRSNRMFRPGECTVNVSLGREAKLTITPAEYIRNVAVIGGGPAGMEAARVCALRGHKVTLYEKRKLGGALIEASVPEFKSDLRRLISYYVTQMKKLKVRIIRREATADTIKNGEYDAVIVAVGATQMKPDVPGVDKPFVTDALQVLGGKAHLGQCIYIVGGGVIGAEVGLFLAEQGKEVIFTTRQDELMSDVEASQRAAYNERLARQKVTIYTGKRLETIIDEGAIVIGKDGVRQKIMADNIVLASGFAPQTALKEQLEKEADLKVYSVGDCVSPRLIYDAIHEGYWVARLI